MHAPRSTGRLVTLATLACAALGSHPVDGYRARDEALAGRGRTARCGSAPSERATTTRSTGERGEPGPAVWRSVWLDGAWGEPREVVSSFAGEPTLTDEGDLIFVHHYYTEGPGEMLEADLYIAWRR